MIESDQKMPDSPSQPPKPVSAVKGAAGKTRRASRCAKTLHHDEQGRKKTPAPTSRYGTRFHSRPSRARRQKHQRQSAHGRPGQVAAGDVHRHGPIKTVSMILVLGNSTGLASPYSLISQAARRVPERRITARHG
jgi:hypothetical protein